MALTIYRTNNPKWIPSTADFSGQNRLSITPYFRAVNFLVNNLASLSRGVDLNGNATSHYLNRILRRRPNNYQNLTQFWRALIFDAVHENNGYGRIRRDRLGRVESLHNLTNEDVTPFRYLYDDGGIEQYYLVRGLTDGLEDEYGQRLPILAASDVLHFMGASYDGQSGMDTASLFVDTFQRAKAIDRYTTAYITSGTHIKSAIEIPEGASTEQVEQIVGAMETYRGSDSESDIMVLFGGAKLNNSTISPVDSQLNEQNSTTAKQIAQVTGVHPFYLYDDKDGKYNNNPDAAAIELVKFTLRPWIDQIEDELTVKLLTDDEQEQGYTVNLNANSLLRGDTKSVSDIAQNEVKSGIRTRNEARALIGLPKDADPASDKLQTLGATTPAEPNAQQPQPNDQPQDGKGQPTDPTDAESVPESQPAAAFAVLAPIIQAACAQIDDKTNKAFDGKQGKPDAERIPWGNVFAETQARAVVASLEPISTALKAMGADALPVARIAERYAAAIKRRVKTNDATALRDIIEQTGRESNG